VRGGGGDGGESWEKNFAAGLRDLGQALTSITLGCQWNAVVVVVVVVVMLDLIWGVTYRCADVDPFHVAWEIWQKDRRCASLLASNAQGCASYDFTATLSGWSQSGISRRLSLAGCIQETVRCRNDFAPCDEARFS
jgi:hypothetical protein